jgi:hypothetical protein
MIKVNLSDNIQREINTGHSKTVTVITHILNTNNDIKSDKTDIYNIALRDLYIIEEGNKYYCYHAVIDTYMNTINLSFGRKEK